MEWVAISFSNAWKWKVKVKSLSRVWLLVTPWTAAYQAPASMGFARQDYWSGVPLPSPMVEWTRSKRGAVTEPTEGVGAGVSFPRDPLSTPSAQARGVSGAQHLLRVGSKARRRSPAALLLSRWPDARLPRGITNTLHRLHLSGCLRLGTGAAALRKASGCSRNGSTSYSKTACKSLWRNRLARSAVNRKVGGSSPPRDDYLNGVFGIYFKGSL